MGVLHHEPDKADAQYPADIDEVFLVQRAEHRPAKPFRVGWLAMAFQRSLAAHEHDKPGEHSDTGEPEAGPPAYGLSQQTAENGGPERAHIDAEIIERKSWIASRIALLVELSDNRRDVRFEKADAHNDERQG